MKKITLTIVFAIIGSFAYSQNDIVNRPNDNGTGLIATEGNDGTGVYCADYFEVNSEVAVGDITVFGFSSSGTDLTPLVTGFNVYIFQDFGGLPGGNPEIDGSLYNLSDIQVGDFTITNDGGNQNDFSVNATVANGGTQVILQPGNYWFVAFPTVDSPPNGDGRWNWTGSLTTVPIEPLLIDPADLFGAGATDWSNISGLIGASFPSFGWIMKDEPIILAQGDNLAEIISIYPNPAIDVINIKVPANIAIETATVYDVIGKKINLDIDNNKINISELSSGVYILELNTSEGTLTQKIVKK